MLSRSEGQWIQVLNRGIGWNQQGRFSEGFDCISEAYGHIPEIAGLAYAEAVARSGDWERGFLLHEKYRPSKRWFSVTEFPEWQGEPLEGKHLLCLAEGGFGDALMCVRFVERLERMGARVTVSVWDSLLPLFAKQRWAATKNDGKPDYWVSLCSLPLLLGITKENCWDGPYIHCPNYKQEHVGICLKAGAKLDGEDLRSMPEEKQQELLNRINRPYIYLTEQNRLLKNWLHTAIAIANCEFVLTVDTAVAHLAGAMGKETHLLLGRWSDWKWGIESENTPWYPTMTIHRNWDLQKVLDRLAISQLEGVA